MANMRSKGSSRAPMNPLDGWSAPAGGLAKACLGRRLLVASLGFLVVAGSAPLAVGGPEGLEPVARPQQAATAEVVSAEAVSDAGQVGAAGASQGQAVLSIEAVQRAIFDAIARSASAIDACHDAHVMEYPSAVGTAKIAATVEKTGAVRTARIETGLEGARNLRLCLERVARTWRFPPPTGARDTADITLSVQVRKGAKFSVQPPGKTQGPAGKPAASPEADGQGKAQSAEDEGFIRFLPESFLPAWTPEGGGD